ncbi:MAG TPA: TonB-dependent receptor [Vicinamibacterales bacterium]|nr:TonB-dependent receptor [Acidobacteriota bacterium]HOC16895.1 TonB-dependent receptor [Vicinamibacterales bacterium]
MKHSVRLLSALALCSLLLAAGAARAQPPAATVSGTVFGPDGALLPGVSIDVRGPGAKVVRVVSADHGGYRVTGLAPGAYELVTHLPGFVGGAARVEVRAGQILTVNLSMRLAALSEEVQVIGTAPRDSVEAPRLGESSARDVGEALSGMAGVWKVRRAGVASDVMVRGYQGENLNVLIDGARLYGACPNNMDHTSFHVDFAEVERVDIAKGPFDMRSQGGLGGTVSIVTRRPGAGFHATPRLAVGSFGYVNPSATVSFGRERVAVLGGYSYRASDPYTTGAGKPFTEGAGYKNTIDGRRSFEVGTAWGRLDFSPTPAHGLQVSYTWQDADLILYPYLQMDGIWDKAHRANLGYDRRKALGVVDALRGQVYYTKVRHWMTDEFRASSQNMPRAYSMATMARTETVGGRAEATLSRVVAGVEVFRREWETTTSLRMTQYQPQHSIPDVGLTSAGAFVEWSQPLFASLTLDAGGRLDRTRNEADGAKAATALYRAYHDTARTSVSETNPAGKVRLTWSPAPEVTFSGGVGRTVRVPDPQERFFGLRRMGSDWVGNPSLASTTNTGIDVQVSYRRTGLFLTGSLYRDALDNFIAIYRQARLPGAQGTMNPAARSWRNVNATMTGGEVEGLLSLTDRLFLTGQVSAVRGRQEARAGAAISPNIPEMPPARFRAGLRYDERRAAGGLFGEAEVVYSMEQDRVDASLLEQPTPSWTSVNLRAGFAFKSARVSVGVANLLNRAYAEHLSYQRDPFRSGAKVLEPGRNVYVNLSAVF